MAVAHFGSVRILPRPRQFLRWAKPPGGLVASDHGRLGVGGAVVEADDSGEFGEPLHSEGRLGAR